MQDDEHGLVFRGVQFVFNKLSDLRTTDPNHIYSTHLSFIQIYNEKIYDCLQNGSDQVPLKIREIKQKKVGKQHGFQDIYIENLTEYSVSSLTECQALVNRGERNRVTSKTYSNAASSRSHCIIQLIIDAKTASGEPKSKAKLNFCDLVGSEKLSKNDETSINILRS